MAEEEIKVKRRTESLSLKNSGKYSLNNMSYPDNVSNSSDTNHYVTFFINVPQSSRSTANRIGFVDNENQNRTQPNSTAPAVAIAAVTAGVGLSSIAGKIIESATSTSKKGNVAKLAKGISSAKALTGIVGAGAVGAAAAATLNVERTQRITDAITLAIQSGPSANYGVIWDTGELGTVLGGVFAGGSSAADQRNMLNVGSDVARRIAETSASVTTAIAGSNQVQAFIESSTKKVVNPQREQLFKSVGFRQFKFDYTFMPKSPAETANVKRIIDTFKYHMHPELSESGIYFIYPSEFDIQYYYRGVENEFINKISSCALINMTVNYGKDQFSTFADGSPTTYNLSLTFVELETMTKERIKEGY